MLFFTFLLITVFGQAFSDTPTPVCPPGSTASPHDSTLCYFVVNETNIFKNAESFCQTYYGANLPKIENEPTNFFIGELARSNGFDSIWIGATDNPTSKGETCSNWYWTHWNEFLSFNDWAPSEPSSGDCAMLSVKDGYYWHSQDCNTFLPTICQIPAVYSSCDSGWELFNGTQMCYKTFIGKLSFDDAEAYCQDRGAHLVSIHNEEENEFVVSISASGVVVANAEWWLTPIRIGLYRFQTDPPGTWHWIDGTSVDYTNWDRAGSNYTDTSYAFIWSDPISDIPDYYKHWDHYGIAVSRGFVCKKAPNVPTPICPPGSTASPHDSTLCYFVMNETNPFYNAEFSCQLNTSAHLPKIKDAFTNFFIGEIARSSGFDDIWIGATDTPLSKGETSSVWYWTYWNELLSYTDWAPSEPSSGNCASLSVKNGYKWHSQSCDDFLPTICQIPAVYRVCDPDWSLFNGTCYKTFINPLSFDNAEAYCQARGAHLVSIHNEEENEFVVSISASGVVVADAEWWLTPIRIGLY
ncbi:hypothetical protein FO519_009725, partial [Halicephalobus sp. NKZ332]